MNDVAELAGVHPRTVRKAIAAGKLRAQRDEAREWRIEQADAAAYVAAHDTAQGRDGSVEGRGPGRPGPHGLAAARAADGPSLVTLLVLALDREQRAHAELEAERVSFTTRLDEQAHAAKEREAALQAKLEEAVDVVAGVRADRERLATTTRLVLDGRWRARRRARRELRALLEG